MSPRGARGPAATLLLALALGACAPPPRPVLTVDDRAQRYREARDRRDACLRALTADAVVRVDGRETGPLPAISATLALAAPDRLRLRARGLVGVALDACVRGDSVVVWVPSQRAALVLGGAGETLAVGRPAELLARAIGATWDPPIAAWRASLAERDGETLAWRDGDDSLALTVDRRGTPLRARIARDGRALLVRYAAWTRLQGRPFPSRLEIADAAGRARVRLELDAPRAASRPDEGWFAQRVPADVRKLDWAGLRERLGHRGPPQ